MYAYKMVRNDDGTWSSTQATGWREEHGLIARLWFWLRRLEHCNDREGRRRL